MRHSQFNWQAVRKELDRRKEADGLTREKFAELISTETDTVSRERLTAYITGRANPSDALALRIAEKLGIDPDILWIPADDKSQAAFIRLLERVDRLERGVTVHGRPMTDGNLALVAMITDYPERTHPKLPDFQDGYDAALLAKCEGLQEISIPLNWLKHDVDLFAVRVDGIHLQPDFHDGEVVFVSPNTSPADSNWVYFQPKDGQAYFARHWTGAEGVTIMPAGSQKIGIPPLLIHHEDAFPAGRVIGTVVASTRLFRRME